MEDYDEDQVELFKRQLKDSDHSISPQVWSELDNNGFRIYIRYFSHVQDLAVNKRALENRLYKAFKNNSIEMVTPQYIRMSFDGLQVTKD